MLHKKSEDISSMTFIKQESLLHPVTNSSSVIAPSLFKSSALKISFALFTGSNFLQSLHSVKWISCVCPLRSEITHLWGWQSSSATDLSNLTFSLSFFTSSSSTSVMIILMGATLFFLGTEDFFFLLPADVKGWYYQLTFDHKTIIYLLAVCNLFFLSLYITATLFLSSFISSFSFLISLSLCFSRAWKINFEYVPERLL